VLIPDNLNTIKTELSLLDKLLFCFLANYGKIFDIDKNLGLADKAN